MDINNGKVLIKKDFIDQYLLPDGRISLKGTAKLIGITPKTLHNIKKKTNIPKYIKIRGRIYFWFNEILEWLDSNQI